MFKSKIISKFMRSPIGSRFMAASAPSQARQSTGGNLKGGSGPASAMTAAVSKVKNVIGSRR